MHTPGPEGAGRQIEFLRPTTDDVRSLPSELLESSKKHFSGRKELWYPESELVSQILADKDAIPYAYPYPERLWILVKSNWDVFSNMGAFEDWWRLGNLHVDSVADVLNRFEANTPLGLHVIHRVSPKVLAKRYGDPAGRKIYGDKDDYLGLCVARYCEESGEVAAARRSTLAIG